MISVLILTYNDEVQIANCLESIIDLTDDIIVVDSQSTDRTIEICEFYGAVVHQNKFINQAIQFNWALDNVPIKHDWVLRLDSDEIVPEKLRCEIKRRLAEEEEYVAYYLNRRMYWMNHWLKHGRMYPHFIVRLFRKGKARYEEKTEEHLIVDGLVGKMQNDFLEDNKKNDLDYFTEKHLATARGELAEIVQAANGASDNVPAVRGKLFAAKVHRTRWLKENLYARTPLFVRPFFYFFYRYFLCLGFLDGVPGLTWHILQGFWYRFYIDAKVYEAHLGEKLKDPVDYWNI
jgi:glycosyltransferase involved in cell wall biosynthesis